MELCEKSLEQALLKNVTMNVDDVFTFTRQMLLALEILHRNNLVHLDIKPGNIFIKNGRYKLGDFGLVSKVRCAAQSANSSCVVVVPRCHKITKMLIDCGTIADWIRPTVEKQTA